MKITILKAVLGWDEETYASTDVSRVIDALGKIGVTILITEATRNETPALTVHNALVDEIDSGIRQELPTRDDLPVAKPAGKP